MTDHARATRPPAPTPSAATFRPAASPLGDRLNDAPAGRALAARAAQLNAAPIRTRAIMQMSRPGSDDMDLDLGPRTLRTSTRRQSLRPADSRTRQGARNEAILQGGAPEPRNVAQRPFRYSSDDVELWDGQKRFPWHGFDDLYFQNHGNGVMNNGRLEYLCHTGPGTTAMLPRKGDRRNGETAFATIGHIVQWRDYIASRMDPSEVRVEGGTILAYPYEAAYLHYADIDNLQLEGNVYNSQTSARPYGGDPLTQAWVTIDPVEDDGSGDSDME